MILTNEHFKTANITSLNTLMLTFNARTYFANQLFQDKFLENREQILSDSAFDDLYRMIFEALLASLDDEMEYYNTILITISIFHYYKRVGKANQLYYIADEIAKKNNSFMFWSNNNFWLKFFDYEREAKFNSKSDNYATNYDTNFDLANTPKQYTNDQNFMALLSIAGYMIRLNLRLEKILICMDSFANDYITDKRLIEELKSTVTKQFYNKAN